jgi:hypothetical protein
MILSSLQLFAKRSPPAIASGRRRAMMARTGACVVLILLGAGPAFVAEASAGNFLSNLFHESHVRRPPQSIPRLGRAARVPLPHARPEGAPSAQAAREEIDAQPTSTSTAASPLPTVTEEKPAPAKSGAVIFPPVATLE